MVVAKFEEKTYEVAYDIELATGAGGTPTVWAPGQVLEHLLGFDASANPGPEHPLWTIVNASRPPGVVLLPAHWSGFAQAGVPPATMALPSHPVSFIVQYKRPEYLYGARAKQWKFWRVPFFRFKVDPAQQRVLKRLETKLAVHALVRYAAPAFHLPQELDTARLQRSVIARSGHVSPSALIGHSAWTYRNPGDAGRANPGGSEHEFARFADMFLEPARFEASPGLNSTELVPVDVIAGHVGEIARAATLYEPELRSAMEDWRIELSRAGLSNHLIERAASFAAMQTMVARLGASWWIIDGNAVA